MANGFSGNFGHLIIPTEVSASSAVSSSMVVVDTNVLLDLYRFTPNARKELLEVLAKLGERLWIPDQVAKEFHENRVDVILGHDAAYINTEKALEDATKRLLEVLTQLGSRVALPEEAVDQLKSGVETGLGNALEGVRALRSEHGIPRNVLNHDDILEQLQILFKDKVGDALSTEDQKEVEVEARRRIDQQIPPGYKDKDKPDPYGDYILWYQTLAEANDRKMPVLIVTRDVKEDWFWRVDNRPVAARPELVRECRNVADVPLVMMNTKTFLQHARGQLEANVSDSTLSQVSAMPKQVQDDENDKNVRRAIPIAPSTMAEVAGIARSYADALQRSAELVSMEIRFLDSERMGLDKPFTEAKIIELSELSDQRARMISDTDTLRTAATQLDAEASKGAGSVVEWTPTIHRAMRMMASKGKLDHLAEEY